VILRCKVGVLARYSETCGTRGDGEGERKRREGEREGQTNIPVSTEIKIY
jgi:hypothetical protein